MTYNRVQNSLALLTDSGAQPSGTITPGSGSQSNSQCTLLGAGSSVAASGNVLTMNLSLSFGFDAAFTGTQNVYGMAQTAGGVNTGWQALGTFTVNTQPASSIWPSTATPAIPFLASTPLTLGVKFRSDVSGNITGLRFYKGAGNSGTHIGLLYSAGGTLLAQATFTAETASGWQQVNFATPVQIAANTVYIAAYFSTTGFAYSGAYFSTGVDNPPLHALASGVSGPNGVYAYGSAAAFPSFDGVARTTGRTSCFRTRR